MNASIRFGSAAAAAGLLGTLAHVPAVTAAGFNVPEISAAGVAMANALVANPEELGAIPYNPAAMGFHDATSLAAGVTFLAPSFSVRTASGNHDSENADWFALPLAQLAVKLDDQWSWGVGINAPFGLETRWPVGTFPELTGEQPLPSPPFPPGSAVPLPQPTVSKLEVVDITPTLTYRVTDELALSAGADVYWAKSAAVDSSLTRLRGDGYGFGFNLSALYVQGPWSLGANFHSAATIGVNGQYEITDPSLARINALLGQPRSQPMSADLDLPWRLQLGFRYAFTEHLAAEVDWTRTGWSEFKRLVAKSRTTGVVLVQDVNAWKDTDALRLGLSYDINDATQLRFGYSYDESAQPNEHFSPRVPDSVRHLFGFGLRQAFSEDWQLEASYMYVTNESRSFRGSRAYDPNHPTEINGTTAVAGKYDADAHLIALQLSKSFTGRR